MKKIKVLTTFFITSVLSISSFSSIAQAEEMTVNFSESLNQTQSKTIVLPKNSYIRSVKTDNGNVSYSKDGTNLTISVSNGNAHRSEYNPYKFEKPISTSQIRNDNNFASSIPYNDGEYTGTYTRSGAPSLYSGYYTPEERKYVSITRQTLKGQTLSSLPTSYNYQDVWEGSGSGFSGRLNEVSSRRVSGTPAGEKTVTYNSPQDTPRTQSLSSVFGSTHYYSDAQGYSGSLPQKQFVVTSQLYELDASKAYWYQTSTASGAGLTGPPSTTYGIGAWNQRYNVFMHKVRFQVDRNGWKDESDGVDYFKSTSGHLDKWTRGFYNNSRNGNPIIPWAFSSMTGRNYSYTDFRNTTLSSSPDKRYYTRFKDNLENSVTSQNHHEGYHDWYYSRGYMVFEGKVYKPNDEIYEKTYSGEVVKPAFDNRQYIQYYSGTAYKPGYDDYYRYNVTVDYVIDNELPDFNLSANPTTFTNQDVTITANNVKDAGESGLRGIQLPNGTWVNAETVPYRVSTNGTYLFRAEDNVGNATTRSISVTNIDKNAPTATLTQSPTTWTNGNVLLTLSDIEDTGVAGLKEIVMPDGKKETTFTDKTFEVTEPGTYTFQVIDNAGNTTDKTITISNIDREAPEADLTKNPNAFTNADVTIQLRNVRDIGTSGVKSVTLPNGQLVTPGNHDYVASTNGQYDFLLEDNAGNETVKTIDVDNIDRIKPSANFSLSTTEATRDDVFFYIKDIQDEGVSGLKYVKYPDGTFDTTFEDKAYPLKKNGTYTFEISDNAGNSIQHTVTVINIDQEPPTADVMKTPDAFTKDPVKVRIHNIRDIGFAGLKSVTHPDGTVTKDEEISYIVDKNEVREFILEDNIGNKRVLTVDVDNIDNEKPEADMRVSTEEMTNQNVVLYLENLRDKGVSGLKSVTLPNGTVKTSFEDIAYTVSSNNVYTFILEDNAGNVTEKVFDVKNIDKLAPTADLSQTPTSFTNKDVTLELSNILDAGVSRLKVITLPNGEKVTTFEDKQFDVTSNGTYQFVIEDHAGNKTTKTITVGNIDKVAPTASLNQNPTSLTNTDVTLTLSSIADTGVSGLENIKLPNGSIITPKTTTSFSVETNGTYRFIIRDKAGNETVKEITVGNIDKSAPSATLRASTTAFTNRDVTLYLEDIQDVGVGGMKSIVLPNGQKQFSFEDKSYIVTENGEYTFTLEDNAGNVRVLNQSVANIDKTLPAGTFSYDTSKPNDGFIINLNTTDDMSGIKEITLPDGRVVSTSKADFSVKKGGNYDFIVEDKAGNRKTLTAVVKSPSVNVVRDKLELVVTVTSNYTAEPVTKRKETLQTWNSKSFRVPVTKDDIFTFQTNDGGVLSDEVTFVVDNFFSLSLPQIDVTYDKKWTNQNVVLNLSVYSIGGTPIVSTTLPDNTTSNLTKFNYTISENGMYTFVAKDALGRLGYQTVIVKNIDKKAPLVELTTPTDWVNRDVPIDIKVTNN